MTQYDFDLVTIGAGSGGVRASRMAAGFGARVAICEESRVGGTCVIRGCVPKKLLVYSAHFADDFEDAAGYGWQMTRPEFSWASLIAAKNKEIDRLNGVYLSILKNNDVTLLEGRGRVIDPHTVQIGDKTYTTANILLAMGSWPVMPDIPGIDHVITSNEALDLMEQPSRIVIVGGGYIAVEFAGIFNGLGSHVTEIIRAEHLLRGFDDELSVSVGEEMVKRGIDLRTNTTVRSIEKVNGSYVVETSAGEAIEADLVMYATGRAPNTKGLGLEEAGVEMDAKGAVVVDRFSCSSVPGIYAVGDVTDRMNLTPVAIAEGTAFAKTVFAGEATVVDYSNVPTAVFSQPPLGTVGLTETEARAAYGAIDVYKSTFRPMRHTLSGRDEKTLMKLLVDRQTQKVLGCHMMGMDAPEIVQGLAIALKCGATKADFDNTVGIHPSAAEEFVTMREPVSD